MSEIIPYDVRKFPWYSPKFVIQAFHKLAQKYSGQIEKHDRKFRVAHEMFETAIALLGVYKLDESNKYFMQTNQQSKSPDVVAVKLIEENKLVTSGVSQVEVVTMEEHSPENNVVDFLLRTKFSNKKSYSQTTLILCTVNKKIQINLDEVRDRIKEINPKSALYILGKVPETEGKWVIYSPHPITTKPVTFDVAEVAKEYWLPDSLVLQKGAKKSIVYEKTGEQVEITVEEFFKVDF